MKSLALAASIAVALPAGRAAAAPAGQRFTLTARDDRATRVVATGPIRGAGTVRIRSSADNRVDHMTLRLPAGSVFLVAVEQSFSVHRDRTGCRAVSRGRGRFRITGGTRAYRGARGGGSYRRRTVIRAARAANGACLARPAATTTKVRMTGRVAPARSQRYSYTWSGVTRTVTRSWSL